MTSNLTVAVENKPGALARLTEALAAAGVNIEGMCCFVSQGLAITYLAVEDASAARRVIETLGLRVYDERPVVVIEVEDVPGTAAKALRRLADAGINLDLVYLATATRLVIGSDDSDAVRHIF